MSSLHRRFCQELADNALTLPDATDRVSGRVGVLVVESIDVKIEVVARRSGLGSAANLRTALRNTSA